EVVDASGMVVAPGFIDIQSHSIMPLFYDPRCLSKITQGVTTEIMGEGSTPAPVGGRNPAELRHTPYHEALREWQEKAKGWSRFGDWLTALTGRGVSPNVGSFLGGGTLRQYGRGMDLGESSAEELATMRRVMGEAMEDGAFGVSYALIYPPDTFASTEEIASVCEVVARFGGVYITHMRSEAEAILEGLDEAMAIGRRSGAAVEIYHLKASGQPSWHLMPEVMRRITQARAEGLDITADMYPYIASGTGLSSCLPPWAAAGGKFFQNLTNPEMRARIREACLNFTGGWSSQVQSAGLENIMPIGFERPEHQQYVGQRLSQIVAERGGEWPDVIMDLLAAEGQRVSTIYFKMSEENVREQLRQPWIKISSDAGGVAPEWAAEQGPVHPRGYGTFTRVLGKYVREERILTLEEAVQKMTSSVANRLSLWDRGQVRPNFWADLVIFDPKTVGDVATFEQPHQLSVGVRDVWVNGTRVLRDGQHTNATPGQFVKGPGAK
ncbi:MAG TPA: D-aminoacylase, partial [Thermomicrobiaceae bacterium]|nr:D-aminoacylase [Thermomicrobiaceae bacterium]